MRKDDNLSTDVDRIPQFSWILFLKSFDDFEKKREALDKNYQPSIPEGYRWKDWASETGEKNNKKKVLTGTDLIKFVNDDLFPTLEKLVGGKGQEQKDVIASVFKELNNRFVSGFVLRKVLNLVDKINFVSTDDIHTMANMYEHMLVEMRDAAGSNGEFYTPRPVIRFIVNQIKPNLSKSEKVLDPACGTGGFLVESLEFMRDQVKSKSDNKKLGQQTLYGIEKKPMPYLLGMMNLLLHEIDKPNIVRKNTLGKPLREISEDEQYDIIMTNPPFGGEEEEGISLNLPVGMRTSDTALSFLLFLLYSLRQKGRCAIILPNSALSVKNTGEKIRRELLENHNLHTVIRLPKGVFSPYTDIATNILFFDKTHSTKNIWYYEQTKRKTSNYSKSKPFLYEEFSECEKWHKNKKANDNAWSVSIEKIKIEQHNLEQRNTSKYKIKKYDSPEKIIKDIIKQENEFKKILKKLQKSLEKKL